jgi:hypothetical protein
MGIAGRNALRSHIEPQGSFIMTVSRRAMLKIA